MKTKHTPGPWSYETREPCGDTSRGWIVTDPQSDNNDVLAHVDNENTREELGQSAEVNARLIAAAPDLLEALINTLSSFKSQVGRYTTDTIAIAVIKQAEAAIARAEGR